MKRLVAGTDMARAAPWLSRMIPRLVLMDICVQYWLLAWLTVRGSGQTWIRTSLRASTASARKSQVQTFLRSLNKPIPPTPSPVRAVPP